MPFKVRKTEKRNNKILTIIVRHFDKFSLYVKSPYEIAQSPLRQLDLMNRFY